MPSTKKSASVRSSLIGFKKRWSLSTDERRQLVERDNRTLSIRQQCSLLQLNRSVYYYQKLPDIKPGDKTIMNLIDEVYTDFPEYGAPRMTDALVRLGAHINHKKVARLISKWDSKPIILVPAPVHHTLTARYFPIYCGV